MDDHYENEDEQIVYWIVVPKPSLSPPFVHRQHSTALHEMVAVYPQSLCWVKIVLDKRRIHANEDLIVKVLLGEMELQRWLATLPTNCRVELP
jgi:hypothetical protein